ncbi:MAG: YkvA family protein [Chitinophagales bacterium]|nr:YkvA family protein [Chitinophagales bacterium]
MAKSKNHSSGKENIDEQFVREGAKKVSEKEVEQVAANAEEIEDKFKSSGRLGRYIEDARLMLSLIKDYWRGDYRKILWFTIAAIVFALLYVLNPLDLIPDILPIVGFIDDALAFSVAFKLVEKDLKKYKEWKLQQKL